MQLFDTYVMVDWSGGNSRKGGKKDCIWIAYGLATNCVPTTMSPRSRTEAVQEIRSILAACVARKGRVLLCADFAYGYPKRFASLVPNSAGVPAWRKVWRHFDQQLQDDIGTRNPDKPSNKNNRFSVASAINARVLGASPGPFFSLFKAGSHPHVPQNQPPQPFASSVGEMNMRRITDDHAGSGTPFRLFGNGSVGGQSLTGIPRLEKLRSDPEFEACSAVWPFETGWAPSSGAWLDPGLHILHAEIYPSVGPVLADLVRDRGQVRGMWHWARNLDAQGLLIDEFKIPQGIVSGSREDEVIRSEEGWILGCPPNPPRLGHRAT